MRILELRGWNSSLMVMSIPFKLEVMQNDSFPDYDVFIQYTGTKDKNGQKIYDGDIVKINGKFAKVEYGQWDGGSYDTTVYGYGTKPSIGPIDAGIVMGNIYENPELLTK